ncbi:MAG: hypothetical protein R6U57_10840 [Anaerolineales bacterium]
MNRRGLTTRIIPVHILTASYRILGEIKVSNTGMQGLLTDNTSSYVIVTDASLARVHDPNTLFKEVEAVRVLKNHIHSAGLKRRQDIGPKGLKRVGYERLFKFDVQITNAVYEYEGILEWFGPFDFSALISTGPWDFIPLYETSVRAIEHPELYVTAPAMLLNRTHISSFLHSIRKNSE